MKLSLGPDKKNCANVEVQRPLIAITVLPLTGVFSMYSY